MRSLRSLSACLLTAAMALPAAADGKTGAAAAAEPGDAVEARNKALAQGFYEDLWFNDRTERWKLYVADEYVVHDIGDRKAVTEPGIEQKRIADFLHAQGRMTGSIDYQIAEGDLVATRWQWRLEPTSWRFRLMGGAEQIPIINVFRLEDGKIVEIWNHRHDIDAAMGNIAFVQGLGLGLVVAAIGWGAAFLLWWRARRGRRMAMAAAPAT